MPFGHVFSVEIKRAGNEINVAVTSADGSRLYERIWADGETHTVMLPVQNHGNYVESK